ncbi:MAG: hypothetical protein ACXV5R_13420, partial [Candidatus Angelobacter sp.]
MAKAAATQIPEARYTYYRRCQLFRRNGDQCKAPAAKGEAICHAHAAQQAMAFRWDLERQIVLAKAVAEMRRRGKPECEMADLFTDFKGIQLTLAEVSRALIHGRIDCKTAGRLLVHLQTMSKLLWMVHRKGREGRKENQGLPQVCADRRRLSNSRFSSKREQAGLRGAQTTLTFAIGRDIGGEESRVAFEAKVRMFPVSRRVCRDGPWQQARAA